MYLGSVISSVTTKLSSFTTVKSETKVEVSQANTYWEGTAYDSFEDSYRGIDKNIQNVCNAYSLVASKLGSLQSQIDQEEERRREEAERERQRQRERQKETTQGW